jgi:hypothetical protein
MTTTQPQNNRTLFGWRRPPEPAPVPQPAPSLSHAAQELLPRAAATPPTEEAAAHEERSVRRPDSWLLQNCWETLADAGAGPEALAVARAAAARQPLAVAGALYRLSRSAGARQPIARLAEQTLNEESRTLLVNAPLTPPPHFPQLLLYTAATSSLLHNNGLALSYLEKLDQTDRAWDRIIASPDLRTILGDTLVRIGPTPLVLTLIDQSVRRFGDGGADLLLHVCEQIDPAISPDTANNLQARLLRHCVDVFRLGTLTTLHSHRIAAAVYARAGRFQEVLQEVTTIGYIQEARQLGGISLRQGDQNVLRQVKRPQADADIDFQVYTLREAIRAVPVRYIPREARIDLAKRLAELGLKSDGWTAAGAAASLADLGALKFAADVVSHIAPTDPTRSEGTIALVRGLLAVEDLEGADEEVRRALQWARGYKGRNPERALIWGLADAYLEFGHPDRTLDLIAQWRDEATLTTRLRQRFSPSMGDDELRLKRLRLQALLQMPAGSPAGEQDETALLGELTEWAPRLLEGEALIDFYADGLLRPLLTAGRNREAWALLPAVQEALSTSTGEKHAARARQVSSLLARQVRLLATRNEPLDADSESMSVYARFVADLWQADSARGLWQLVHGINGSLPLVLALEGPGTVQAIARVASENGEEWG